MGLHLSLLARALLTFLWALGAQTPLARCTARVHWRHRDGQVHRSFHCLGSPGALDFGFALHFFLLVSFVNSFFDGFFYRWDSQAYAAEFFGEASASAPTTTVDYANAPGHRGEERWQCGASVWALVALTARRTASLVSSLLPIPSFLCFPLVSFSSKS